MKNKIALVYSDYYQDITDGLIDGFYSTINKEF